ncbi:diphthine--ammonia ligase [Virgibacillus necropolis]|uniref:Dph6-related ATP pyrophosphatase n=1 Tax=Virgibacillus necropolis TaxID=163877 RepID=UPI00384B34C4
MSKQVALSFSGGKDSCFSLYKLHQQNIKVSCLITTIWEQSQKSVAHDQKQEEIIEQAKSIGIPVHFMESDFDTYSEDFVHKLKELKKQYEISGIAFGDIYLDGHREWGEQVAQKAGLEPLYPIWTKEENVSDLLQEVVDIGFKAAVIKVDKTKLPEDWVGRILDQSFINDILQKDVCPMGESGEYHTAVYEGPIFNK